MKLSRPPTPSPLRFKASDVWNPTKPAAPVTSTTMPPTWLIDDSCARVSQSWSGRLNLEDAVRYGRLDAAYALQDEILINFFQNHDFNCFK